MSVDTRDGLKLLIPKGTDNAFRVLGVAMVVDQRGIGARMVARYPTQPSPRPGEKDIGELPPTDDLFFTLTSRQMAKLFRTKKALCRRPMTLTVNGTVFCCHATLLDGDESSEDTSASNNNNNNNNNNDTTNKLVLFSVIVALSSPVSQTSVPFLSWLDGATDDQLDLQRYLKEASHPGHVKHTTKGSVSSSFLAIRRVHISLARYCRVMEREENRCRYVSSQTERLFQIRNDRQKKWDEQKAAAGSPNSKQQIGGNTSSTSSVMSAKSSQTADRRGRHIRASSFSVPPEELHSSKSQRVSVTSQQEQEREQEILELMLAAPEPEGKSTKQQGNMMQELVQFFHSLSRNDLQYPPTATALLSERDGVIYVNRHIAVPVEAATLKPSQTATGNAVRPYNTLLFPHASPSELLQAFQASGSAPPQRLQQVLLTVNPQKPLTEIAVDANLPLYTTIEIASYLVTHGACVTSPVVSRSSRLACLHIEKIPELALEFSQTFTNVNFFRLVSFLTASKTLGEAMVALTGVDNDEEGSRVTGVQNEEGEWLRECLAPSGNVRQDLSKVLAFPPDEQSPKGAPPKQQPQEQQSRRWVEELEELLFAMAVWLLSHRVLTQIQDYLVYVEGEGTQSTNNANEADESLFRELLESDFLDGNVSIMALSWRLGLDQQKLRSWGLRHNKIRVVSRIPTASDDWESE